MNHQKGEVYTIASNEEKHIKRWYESAKDADLLVLADVGSTDGTIQEAERLRIQVHQITMNPSRFDSAKKSSPILLQRKLDLFPIDAVHLIWRK